MIFSHFRSLSIKNSAFINIFWFGSDTESKFQIFTLFTGRHIGGLGSVIVRGTFRRISQLWDNAHTLNLANCLLYLSSIISQFFDFIQRMVFDFIFYWVTMYTLCRFYSQVSPPQVIFRSLLASESLGGCCNKQSYDTGCAFVDNPSGVMCVSTLAKTSTQH